ncbi:Patched family protein [Nitzschia inconspicua]|uniref:Patched family protein n=1 Tax=Nitzschia inconspicua TaxID=303405 RepID=A0A9K3M504_9STRA|nr:Patched family protein [Nitzschia inconspicua]
MSSSSKSCTEAFGDTVEGNISGFFGRVGLWVGHNPRKTIGLSILVTVSCGIGFLRWETENRPEELWLPQNTQAEVETAAFTEYFGGDARINTLLVQSSSAGENVLTKELLISAMQMSEVITTEKATADTTNYSGDTFEGEEYSFVDLCVQAGGSCVDFAAGGVCTCLMAGILKQWNYDLATLEADDDILESINQYGTKEDLETVLGNPVFDENGRVISADAFVLSYFLQDRSFVEDGTTKDPVNEGWEKDVFLSTAEAVPQEYPLLSVDYFSSRSFEDEFGGAISGDLIYVNISYILAFLFVAANLGKIRCGTGSRWTLALAAVVTVGLSTAAGLGLSSAFGLFYGPVHSILPFILLGVGVDDAFVIANAFDRERKVPRSQEVNESLAKRTGRALARAGSSITVTSLTDFVAFAISASSVLPALASFCAYAAISIFFLWIFAATFFSSTMVLDERRQRDNRRECLCCLTRSRDIQEDEVFEEGIISKYFRNYHAPAILSPVGKIVVTIFFSALLGFGLFGAINLSVEDTEREFIPADSYLKDFVTAFDEYFPAEGIEFYVVFEDGSNIYENRQELAELNTRLTGLSGAPTYIAEPVTEKAYRNVMTGLSLFLSENGSGAIGNVTLGDDMWPTSEEDFYLTLSSYASMTGPGAVYAQDVVFDNSTALEVFRVKCEYVRLTKLNRNDEIIDDADRQIDAMDATRALVESWTDLQPAFPYSAKFTTIEGFKVIQTELYRNVGLAVVAVGVIVFVTVASPVTALLITLNVAFCLLEILGFMWALGFAIDSVTVINLVLAVGLSVDYSAHVGHSFMVKGGDSKDRRVLEALADMGAAVLAGGTSTFLAVVVLLFSDSYVFFVLSRQFCLTVVLGLAHGLIFLPVLLSLFGPKPFSSAEALDAEANVGKLAHKETVPMDQTGHDAEGGSNSDSDKKRLSELEEVGEEPQKVVG